ncbi:diaminopimelate decarboxylase [Uliginosibacterium sp. H3]|uniref:Diaminopimelate decarboxylase n=1 Tax=Uliginosibacterium silvisoli TaxID=3114758 RepID=A0ABU6JY27_9RHOO|nr:diaminopimelate decarboxylase [Uliginosibacterium sp. H3]
MTRSSAFPVATLTQGSSGLQLEAVALADIAARFGTPTYVYSRAALEMAWQNWAKALVGRDTLVCYAVKANSNLGILNVFARLGAGFDIVSGGELSRVLAAGGAADKVVFSGVGKSRAEMQQALRAGVRCFNLESPAELDRIESVAAEIGVRAPIAFRVNPDVDPKTHPYISTGLRDNKFGVAFDEALALYRKAAASRHVKISGIACHIGSQLLDPAPMAEAAAKIRGLVEKLESEGITLEHIDLGGGLGIRYDDEQPPGMSDYTAPLLAAMEGRKEQLCFEPGRSLVGNAGLLLTQVEYLKHSPTKNFAIVDAAMNDLARPALYNAYHEMVAVKPGTATAQSYEIVGPICESGDFLGHDRQLALAEGDLIAILSAGAYGMAMSSNYNTRGRCAEVMVDGDKMHLVRQRESIESLYALESVLP